jgi:hypothetical protein
LKVNEGYFAELGKSAEVRRLVTERTEAIADAARASAEVDTRAYRDGIEVQIEETAYRVVGHVIGTDPGTMAIESRTGNLGRALRSVNSG